MKLITKTVSINASASQVYEFASNPKNLPEIWPSLIEVSNIKNGPEGADSFDWVYKMAGVHLKGHSDALKRVPDKYSELESKAGVKNHMIWTYDEKGGRTDVTLKVEYDIPIPLIGKLAESVLVKLNEREIGVMLENLKERCEAGAFTQPSEPKAFEKRV